VTEPGLTPVERVGRVRELRQEADAAITAYRSRIVAAGQARERALAVTGEARSRDGSVRAEVDATGVVTGLTLGPGARNGTPETLATTIVATIQEAAARARTAMADAMAPLRAGGEATRSATAAVPELAALRFELPAVPRTAIDPTTVATGGWTPPPHDPDPDGR
jgi:YbaB/EbfC DNA-binding family